MSQKINGSRSGGQLLASPHRAFSDIAPGAPPGDPVLGGLALVVPVLGLDRVLAGEPAQEVIERCDGMHATLDLLHPAIERRRDHRVLITLREVHDLAVALVEQLGDSCRFHDVLQPLVDHDVDHPVGRDPAGIERVLQVALRALALGRLDRHRVAGQLLVDLVHELTPRLDVGGHPDVLLGQGLGDFRPLQDGHHLEHELANPASEDHPFHLDRELLSEPDELRVAMVFEAALIVAECVALHPLGGDRRNRRCNVCLTHGFLRDSGYES